MKLHCWEAYVWMQVMLYSCALVLARSPADSPLSTALTGEQDQQGMFVIAPRQQQQQQGSGWKTEQQDIDAQDMDHLYLPELTLRDRLQQSLGMRKDREGRSNREGRQTDPSGKKFFVPDGLSSKTDRSASGSWWANNLPKINIRCDPLINFKLKQRLMLLGACVTLGMDYISDIAQWRAYCAIEDTFVRGRFSLRGSELGWTKSWMLNLGLGEENAAKCKLRLGLNLKTYKLYAKLRFRTEPLSPFDIGEGLSCAGKLPLPLYILPMLRSIPLRIEYRLRINTSKPTFSMRRNSAERKVQLSTGLGAVDLSLDELNFCLEWDEQSPLWGIGLVKNEPSRRPVASSSAQASKSGSQESSRSVPRPPLSASPRAEAPRSSFGSASSRFGS